MLLPQSSAFATLKNRLNAVSAIGYLHSAPRMPATASMPSSSSFTSTESGGRPNRLKSRDDGPGTAIRWVDLFEKFRATQERQRKRSVGMGSMEFERHNARSPPPVPEKEGSRPIVVPTGSSGRPGSGMSGMMGPPGRGLMPPPVQNLKEKEKSRSPLGLGRFGGSKKKK
jgi:vacuole morphology and inheritance protein 14